MGLRNTLVEDTSTHLTRQGDDCACFVSSPERHKIPWPTMNKLPCTHSILYCSSPRAAGDFNQRQGYS